MIFILDLPRWTFMVLIISDGDGGIYVIVLVESFFVILHTT